VNFEGFPSLLARKYSMQQSYVAVLDVLLGACSC
jgi:hypothetical protein